MSDLPVLLCALASILLIVVGALALISPSRLSRSYGVPVVQPSALAYVRATGARDVALGAIFAVSAYLQDAIVLFVLAVTAAALALIDFMIAFSFAGGLRSEHAAHLGGCCVFVVIAVLLWASLAR